MLLRSCAVALLAGLAADATASGFAACNRRLAARCVFGASARLSNIRRSCGTELCCTILAGVLSLVLSLVLLTLPASPVLQVKLCAWRMAMQLRDGKRVVNCESRAWPGQLRWRGGL